ncbi:MAG: ATP-dependent Clp protease ATP-binding subunit [Deltaproteobacteria bacterium]|nr:MAG: ATP-dependent Clp protease ATP-binding subunit [Deltaproteobacteria bacterium]
MALDWSKELIVVADEARDVAERLGQPLSTAHLLLCLFTLKNRASAFLRDHRITADLLLQALDGQVEEREGIWTRVLHRAEDVAHSSHAGQVNSLHVLVALCSFVDCAAYRLMARLELDMGTIRSTALSYLMSNAEHIESVTGLLEVAARSTPAAVSAQSSTKDPKAGPANPPAQDTDPSTEPSAARGLREPRDVRRRRKQPGGTSPTTPGGKDARGSRNGSLAKRVHGERKHSPIVPRSDVPLPPTVARTRRPGPSRNSAEAPKSSVPSPSPRPAGPTERERLPRSRFVLREKEFPLLAKLGRNLSLAAWDGALDHVFGRDAELHQLTDILGKRRANNPVLVGDPGVGKTAIVEGLANWIAGPGMTVDLPAALEGRIVVELEASRMLGGTGVRGAFAERLQRLKQEVAAAEGRVIVFLDELHHWIGMGAGGDGASDGAGELKTALARGSFPCIGATTFEEYRRFIETDPAFERRFQQVRVDEPSPESAVTILERISPRYEEHHQIRFEPDALHAAAHLSFRYIQDRRLPDKAISVLDLAGSRARRIGARSVGRPLVATVIAEQAGLSPEKLLMADRERFLNMEERLMQRVVGHQHVIERVSHVLRRNYAGFVSGRPIGSFLFLGPTGVGKTEFARAIASILFESENSVVRIDMSEYMEAHAVSRLIGSPPGYVGHDAGGLLTEAVRRQPYQLVLLDEVEKAHPDVLNLLLQVLDDGRLTDARGRTVDFSNTIIVLTSNLGAEVAFEEQPRRPVGFVRSDEGESGMATTTVTEAVLAAARRHFRPELWNRIDEPLVFRALQRDEVARIARLQLTRSSERLYRERQVAFTFAPEVIDFLLDHGGYDAVYGARPMRRTIERHVESRVAELLLTGTLTAPAQLEVVVQDGAIRVEHLDTARSERDGASPSIHDAPEPEGGES